MLYDALIIGAGPAGATTALLLAKAGWSVALVEKKAFPRRKVCGEFISATSLPLLQRLGIAKFYQTHGGPEVKRVGLFAQNTILSRSMPKAKHSHNLWGRALGREHLDHELVKMATHHGATLWQPAEVTSVEKHADFYSCMLSTNNQTIEIAARILIMANGSWENSFEQSKSKTHKPSDLFAFKAHFKHSDLANNLMPLLAFPGGYGGLAHSDNGRVTLSCCIRRDTLQQLRKKSPGLSAGDVTFQHIKSTCLGVKETLANALRDGKWLASGPIQPGIRKRYEDGIFYVGNIAGEAHPVIAEGISMAMQSAWLLVEILQIRKNDVLFNRKFEEVGKEYTKKWDTCFANRIHAANLFAQLAMRPWIVSLLLPIIKLFPALLTFGAKLSGKITQIVPLSISSELAANEKENTI